MPDSSSSDRDLMHAVKNNDSDALVFLIQRWETRLLHFIFRYVQNESVARDLVQETFVKIYRYRDRYDENRSFSTWMFSIAVNLCRNHQRWVKRHAEIPLQDVQEPAGQLSPASNAGIRENQQLIADAIKALPHPMKTVILLYYYEEMNYKEIAETTGCSVRGVESRLYRARKLLAVNLDTGNSAVKTTSALRESGQLTI